MTTTEIVLPGIVEPDGLRVEHRELPRPGAGEALIRVEATGVSFAEQQMRRGKYYDQPPFPFVPGYDVVGTVLEADDPTLAGRRVAALTKTGGWRSHVVLPTADLVPVPDGLDAAEAETFVVNGITAWQMLHRVARVRRGGTILVHGASGGVGTTLVQLARAAGISVIGTASARNQDVVTALGATAVDYRGDVPARVRELAPAGVDAVFDHVGGPGIVDSFRLLAPGGTLVAYGSASTKDDPGNSRLPVLKLLARLLWWNALPNRRRAHFYNVWGGKRNLPRFRARLAEDLTAVFGLAVSGTLQPQVAARLPLTEAAKALTLAESGTVTGKVVLVP
ncbi:MAG TPA: medium chain dehydrogenase/reductase family protein [Amycolatopsis sp.]|uniref:medium chain dehydrogenase/reductase family protein n=1 Tax=Amycolatopsis sp. TaxID=37632 RepID=UPI002F3FD136